MKSNLAKVLVAVGLALLALVSYFSLAVVLTVIIGVGVGVLMAPYVDFMNLKLKIPRPLGALFCLITVFAIISVAFFAVSFVAAEQFERLSLQAPVYLENLKTSAADWLARYPWVAEQMRTFEFAPIAKASLGQAFVGLQAGLSLISSLIFAMIIGIYFTIGMIQYEESFNRLFFASYRSKAQQVVSECARVLRSWFKAQLLSMAIMGLITAVSLKLAGVSYWAVYGLLTALFGFVPYVGMLFVVVFASLVTLASDPSQLPWLLIVFLITQQLEGNVILPYVMKDQVQLPEVPLMVFMLFFGSWLGIIGVFLAPPIFALFRVLYKHLYQPIADSH